MANIPKPYASRYDKKEIEIWGALLEVIAPLIEHITNREEILSNKLEQLQKDPTLDNIIKKIDLDARLMEIRDLKCEIKLRQELFKREVINDRTE